MRILSDRKNKISNKKKITFDKHVKFQVCFEIQNLNGMSAVEKSNGRMFN